MTTATDTNTKLSPVTIAQLRAARGDLERRFDGDPERQKEELARFDAAAVDGAHEHDRQFAERSAQLKEVARLDAEGPGDGLSPVTKAKLAYIGKLDEFSRRNQGGGFNSGGHNAA